MKKPELLIPASSLEVLKTAVLFGADAVYIGGEAFGLRAKAKNFSKEEMREGIRFAHAHGVKVHVTVNILAHNADLAGAEAYLKELAAMAPDAPDALIIADPGIFMLAKQHCPMCELHVSTQANNTNYATFKFWYDLGAARVVCARELSLIEIAEIRKEVPADLAVEAFVHGAMCISYSGRCLLSNYFTGRDANHGACTHPCRWKFAVAEETRPGQYLPIEETDRGTFIFNSCDLCMVDHIPELVEAGVDSFKIEGRMKNALYVATVARTYRDAIDTYFEDPEKYAAKIDEYNDAVRRCTYRPFSTGFYFGKPNESAIVYDNNIYEGRAKYLGIIGAVEEKEAGVYKLLFEQRNKFCIGDEIEIMRPDGVDQPAVVLGFETEDGEQQENAAHAKQVLWVTVRLAESETCEEKAKIPAIGDILRLPKAEEE